MDISSILHIAPHVARAAEEVAHTAADPGIAGTFGLNLKVFIAQLVNFGIVVFVLWKWVLTPLAKRLEARQVHIQKGLDDAAAAEVQKQEFEVWKAKATVEARSVAQSIILKSKNEAEVVKSQVMESAKIEKGKMISSAKAEIQLEEAKAVTEVKKEITDLVIAATEKILRKKLDPTTDNEIVKQAITEALKEAK